MTIIEVRQRVQHIRAVAGDPERAHSLEDDLRRDVLRHLSEQGHAIAAEALKTEDIDFSRWSA